MKKNSSILILLAGIIIFLSKVLWIKEFDMLFYLLIFILYICSIVIIRKYKTGKQGAAINFILLTAVLCFAVYNENNKNTYVNIVKQKENIEKIYLYEIDWEKEDNFKSYIIYKRVAFLPFFITGSTGKFFLSGEYEKISMENDIIKIIGKANQRKEEIILLDSKTGKIISENSEK